MTNEHSDWQEIDTTDDRRAVNELMAVTADALDDAVLEMRVTLSTGLRTEWPDISHHQIGRALDRCEQMLRRIAWAQAERTVRAVRIDHFIH
jgi:hypothetical protein